MLSNTAADQVSIVYGIANTGNNVLNAQMYKSGNNSAKIMITTKPTPTPNTVIIVFIMSTPL